MKKATAILLSSVIFASLLCSCGKAADSSAASSAVSTKTTSPTVPPTEASTPEPTQQPAGQPASQLFSKVTGFSREWQDGKHVINGLDTSGNKICGIIDGGGNTVLMDGYTALYPLADGHLIAATDENVSGECVYTGRTMELSTAGFAGVILDENGNVIYQPDESLGYERLYPINSHLILSIRAKTGFDGKSASMCVLDQDGQFLYDCTDSSHNLVDLMNFDDDGIVWTFPSGSSSLRRISFGPDDDLGENSILRIDFLSTIINPALFGLEYTNNDYYVLFHFDHDSFTSELTYYSDLPTKENPHTGVRNSIIYNSSCFIRGGKVKDADGNIIDILPWETFPSDTFDCTAIDTWQASVNEIPLSGISFLGSSSSGLGYFGLYNYLENSYTSDIVRTYFTADGKEISIPQNYMDALGSTQLLDNKFLLTLNGADGKTYFTLLDLADGSTFDPVLIPDSPRVVAQNGSVLAICSLSKSFRIYSVENGTELDAFDIPGTDNYSVRYIFFRGNYLIIYCYDDSYNNEDFLYHVYSLSDSALII